MRRVVGLAGDGRAFCFARARQPTPTADPSRSWVNRVWQKSATTC